MSTIKSARIVGVLQDWDIYDERYDIEEVRWDVPLFLLDSYYEEEIEAMCDEEFFGADWDYGPLGTLLEDAIQCGLFEPRSGWELEDPCELHLEVFYHVES